MVHAVGVEGRADVRLVTNLASLQQAFLSFDCGAHEGVHARQCILHCGAGIWKWAFPLGDEPYAHVEPYQRTPHIDRGGSIANIMADLAYTLQVDRFEYFATGSRSDSEFSRHVALERSDLDVTIFVDQSVEEKFEKYFGYLR